MSVTLNDDKFTQQYFIDMMIRSDFKQADVDDPTGIYELGLPKKDTEDGGKSSAIQKEMVQLANIMRKIKVFKASDKFPQDEWEIIKEMPFAKKSIFINKPRSQPNYSKKVNAKPELVEPLLDEMVHQFDKLKRDYMRSKGIDIPLTPTSQLEMVMPEEELILADTVSDIPVPAETRKKTTQKELITMSMLPRRTTRTRKTTSKHRTPTSKRRRTPSKHRTPSSKHMTPSKKTPTPTSKRRRTPSKHRTPSRKTPTPTAKRNHDMITMRTLRSTYNTRKRTQTQATQAGVD